MDWVWSALHLDDGTHLHGVDLRIPGSPPIGVGYIQPPGGLAGRTADGVGAGNVRRQRLTADHHTGAEPGDVTATVEIKGHAPVLLTAADGRVSQFPRAWATVTTADGRTGVGWLEWNRSQH